MTLEKPFDRITIEPGKMGGKPCIRGYRISVEDVLVILASFPDRTGLFANYPVLEEEDLQQALAYSESEGAMVDGPEYRLEVVVGEIRSLRSDLAAPLWTVKVEQLVLLAEYTTDEGPYYEDYFFELWSLEDGTLQRCLARVPAGAEQLLAELSVHLKPECSLGLVQSTDWASRVIWPPPMAGKPYFQFIQVDPKGIWECMKSKVLGQTLEYKPSDEVWSYLVAEKARRLGVDAVASGNRYECNSCPS